MKRHILFSRKIRKKKNSISLSFPEIADSMVNVNLSILSSGTSGSLLVS